MSHWNYRVIRKENELLDNSENVNSDERYSFGIHEVYYDDLNKITSCTVDSMDPYGTTFEELQACFAKMQKAFSEPILDYNVDIPGGDSVINSKFNDVIDKSDV